MCHCGSSRGYEKGNCCPRALLWNMQEDNLPLRLYRALSLEDVVRSHWYSPYFLGAFSLLTCDIAYITLPDTSGLLPPLFKDTPFRLLQIMLWLPKGPPATLLSPSSNPRSLPSKFLLLSLIKTSIPPPRKFKFNPRESMLFKMYFLILCFKIDKVANSPNKTFDGTRRHLFS